VELAETVVSPIRTLVVDDEALARRNLVLLLRRDPDIGSVMECASGIEAIAAIRDWKPDLVFLDVQMPECDGFDVLEMLGAGHRSTIVFVTAFDQYALRAFDAGALDYLLKPFDDARFERALERAKAAIAGASSIGGQPARRLVVKSLGQLRFVDIAKIDWVEAASYYACLHVGDETHLIRRTLAELEQDLGNLQFARIHRSTIVNLDRVLSLEVQSGGDYEVILNGGVHLGLSRRYRKGFQERLQALSA
jgi:two-component system LytT family response regulator